MVEGLKDHAGGGSDVAGLGAGAGSLLELAGLMEQGLAIVSGLGPTGMAPGRVEGAGEVLVAVMG